MNNQNIRTLIVLAIVSIMGIFLTQLFWFRKAFDLNEQRTNQTIRVALQTVGEKLLRFSGHQIPSKTLVSQVSNNYFVVQTNAQINTKVLEIYLKDEFEKRLLQQDFEYYIYDCETNSMVFGNYIAFDDAGDYATIKRKLPVWNKSAYFFGIYFPQKDSNLVNQLGIWLFSSAVLLLVIVFFAYSLWLIFRQKKLSDIQKDFVNNMTHEFKTPLSTIRISSNLLKNERIQKQPDKINHYANIIQHESQRLNHQVETILQTAMTDNHAFALKFELIDLHELINETLQNSASLFQEKKATLNTLLSAQKMFVMADKFHLTNLIFNLVDNALKYSTDKPDISILTRNEKNYLVISIQDKGIGIARKHQKHIFNKFYRVSTGNQHNVKGFGLGLAYVKRIVQLHKGKIKLISEQNKGTEFIIYLKIN